MKDAGGGGGGGLKSRIHPPYTQRVVEFIDVLRHMQQYFSHICDGTDVQAN